MRKLRLPALVLGACMLAMPASAHAGRTEDGAHWTFEGWVVVSLALAAALYWIGIRNMWARRKGCGVGRLEISAFAAGIASLVLALMSPLDAMSEDLFSAHMVQHLTLMLVSAPLFVWSRPVIVFVWALPRRTRKGIGRAWAGQRGIGRVFRVLTAPVIVWIAFCGLFVFWHLPRPYGWAFEHEPLHILEHLCFFVSAFAFWSVVIEPSGRRRLDHGAALLFVATAAILSGLPGALMVLTSRPFYTVHAAGAARWGMTPLEDQHLAGLIMWIPAGFIYMAAIAILFVLWLRAAEKRAALNFRRLAAMSSASVLLLVLAGCEDRLGEGNAATSPTTSFGGDAEQGAHRIAEIGCGSCHTIPGITGADGLVGPPLTQMGRRVFIAGLLRNTPDNMVRWLISPQAVLPGNAMPDMGLQEQQARDIAAYLYTLR